MIYLSLSSKQLESSFSIDRTASQQPLAQLIALEERERVAREFARLDQRSRGALLARYGSHPDDYSIASLAQEWGISRQRVYQLADQALSTLRQRCAEKRT